MKRILKEPLLHFLLLGIMVFAAYKWISKGDTGEAQTIVITQGKIENLATTFARTWQRPPTAVELEGLIRDYIREEVYYREALSMGLDQDDTVIRRRLRQKLEFVSEDIADLSKPTDDDLRNYLNAHPEVFQTESRLSFIQIYLNAERRKDTLAVDAMKILAELRQSQTSVDPSAFGDATLLESRFEKIEYGEIARQFGERFAEKLSEAPIGQWQGPIESGYGSHLVLINERIDGYLPPLDEIREAVAREWTNAKRIETAEQFYQAMLKNYTVKIEKPEPAEKARQVAETR
jgi:hypothetical protein